MLPVFKIGKQGFTMQSTQAAPFREWHISAQEHQHPHTAHTLRL